MHALAVTQPNRSTPSSLCSGTVVIDSLSVEQPNGTSTQIVIDAVSDAVLSRVLRFVSVNGARSTALSLSK